MNRVNGSILPQFDSTAWKTYVPDCKAVAEFSKESNGEYADIFLKNKGYGVGKWICEVPVEGSKTYKFTGMCDTTEHVNDVHYIYTIKDKNGEWLIREHVDCVENTSSRKVFESVIPFPENAVKVEVELWLKGVECKVRWYPPCLIETEALPKRAAKIAVAYIHPEYDCVHTLEGNLNNILDNIDKSAEAAADLIVLSEAMYDRSCNLPLEDTAECIETGKACNAVRQKARQYNCYIAYNLHEFDNGEYYNTTVLFGRNGEICGKYRKTHLTIAELEEGMTPGNEYPVFETDFAKIGMLVCYDHYFSSTAEKMILAGAELVCVATAGDSNAKGIARAMDTGIYYAICGLNTENSYGWGAGRIVAPDGTIVAQTSESMKPAIYEIDFSKKVRRKWLSLGPAESDIKSVYRYEKSTMCQN